MAREAPPRRIERLARLWPFALLAVAGAIAAYFQMFGDFMPLDDEGYLLVSLASFVDGGALYSEVYSQYGPFYYEVFGLLFAVTGRPVTTDAGRLIVLFEWIAIASLLASAVLGLTRSRVAAVAAMAVALAVLPFLATEPMHPAGLVSVLVAVILAATCWGWHGRPWASAAIVGGACGAILMTKVNVGGLACVAVVAALALAAAHGERGRTIRWASVALVVVVPLALLGADLGEDWVQRMLVLVWAGLACILIAALREPGAVGTVTAPLRWLAVFAGAAAAVVLLSAGVAVALGTSVGDLVAGVLLEPTELRDIFVLPFGLPDAVLDWSVAAIVIALAWAFAPRRRTPHVASAAVRLVAGFAVWVSITASSPLTFGPASGRLAIPVLVAWLVVVPPSGLADAGRQRMARLVVALLPVLEVLQVYPVAGSQVLASALLFVPLGAVLLADGVHELRQVVAVPSLERTHWLRICLAAAAVGLVAKFTVLGVTRPLQASARAYDENVSLSVTGAHRVHLPEAEAVGIKALVEATRANCDTFISLPGLNSFYLWTGLRPPTGMNAGDWMFLFDDERQQQVVDAVRDVRRLCLIRSNPQLQAWTSASGEAAPPQRPLMRFIETAGFEPVTNVLGGSYELMVRR